MQSENTFSQGGSNLLTLITNIATQGLQTEPLETLWVSGHLGLGFHTITWLTMRQPGQIYS